MAVGHYDNEGGFGGRLNFFGKLCRYIEEFYGVKLTEEDFNGVLNYDNIMESENFKNGYNYASTLIGYGFDYLKYTDWLCTVEKTHPKLYELYLLIKSKIGDRVDFKRGHFKH